MEFKDWRKSPAQSSEDDLSAAPRSYRGQRFSNYIDEQIREAEERGVFRDLPGLGKPLNLDTNPYAGDKALGYSLLKSNGYVPAEIEMAREIDRELERLASRRVALSRRGHDLRRRRVPPFASERRAYNNSLTKALAEYEAGLRELNRKILTLNLSTPSAMHRAPLDVERMVREFREACPPFT